MSRACHHEGPILSLLSLERGTERKTEIVMVERDRQRQADRKKKQEETERGVETKVCVEREGLGGGRRKKVKYV